jgi:hypothetical protein
MTTITKRDEQLFIKLNQALWLTTSQIGRYFFPDKAANAINKRMRKLAKEGYLYPDRKSSTEELLYRLTTKSKKYLMMHTHLEPDNITAPKRLPQNLKHFSRINDLRSYIEMSVKNQSGKMVLFSTDREIKHIVPNSIIIPDAIARLKLPTNGGEKTINLLLEYDNETENASYFAKDKIKKYMQLIEQDNSLFGLRPVKVLVFADRKERINSLIKQSIKIINKPNILYFAAMSNLDQNDFLWGSTFINPASENQPRMDNK